jgi:hypothetical protein
MGQEMRSVVQVFDADFKLLIREVVKSLEMGDEKDGVGFGPRPSMGLRGNRLFAGNQEGRTHTAEVYVYEISR